MGSTRLHHTKSRFGCLKCKARKIKCDEARPSCSTCLKYSTSCQYISSTSHQKSSSHASPLPRVEDLFHAKTSRLPLNTLQAHPTETRERRLLELRLMHHFISSTSHQTSILANYVPEIKHLINSEIPLMAIGNAFLMNALLSAAALHLAKLNPGQTTFVEAQRRYFGAAVVDQRLAVADINPGNADALCLAAFLISFQTLALPPESQSYTPPVVWLELASGIGALFITAAAWFPKDSKLQPLLNIESTMIDYCKRSMDPEHRLRFSFYLEQRNGSEYLDSESSSLYGFLLGYISAIHCAIEDGEDSFKVRRLLCRFGPMAPPLFRYAVRAREPRALLVLAHYFAVLRAIDDVWWLKGVPEREIHGIRSILPEEWHWAMAWPIQTMSIYAAVAVEPPMETEHEDTQQSEIIDNTPNDGSLVTSA